MELLLALIISILIQKYLVSKLLKKKFENRKIMIFISNIISFILILFISFIIILKLFINNKDNNEFKVNKEYFEKNKEIVLKQIEKNVQNEQFDLAIATLKKYKFANAINYDFDTKIKEINQLRIKMDKENILKKLNDLYKNKEYRKGIELADKYKNKEFFEIKTKLIIELLKSIPAITYNDFQKNYKLYFELLEMNPSNKSFKTKMNFYKEKIDAIDAKNKAEKLMYGDKPVFYEWDGTYPAVEKYLKYAMKDPTSLEIRNCSKVYKIENIGWAVHCSYRGKNSFGAFVLNSNWFIIRHNKVFSVEPSDSYTLN